MTQAGTWCVKNAWQVTLACSESRCRRRRPLSPTSNLRRAPSTQTVRPSRNEPQLALAAAAFLRLGLAVVLRVALVASALRARRAFFFACALRRVIFTEARLSNLPI